MTRLRWGLFVPFRTSTMDWSRNAGGNAVGMGSQFWEWRL